MYCTPIQLSNAKLARELAQVATPERYAIVADELMDLTLRGEDRSSFDPADVAVADEALVHIEKALTDASGVIDGYLRARRPVPYQVPVDPVPEVISVWARWIARYLLHKDRVDTREESDPIVRDYRQALRFLEQVRDGAFDPGIEEPARRPGGRPQFYTDGPRQFTRDTLKDFGP